MFLRSAYTYIELMIVIVVVVILAVVALPGRDTVEHDELRRAATIFEADVDYARSRSIARPDAPVAIKVDADNDRYWLAEGSTPDSPIPHPRSNRPYVRQFGAAAGEGLRHVRITTPDFAGDAVLSFDSRGATDQETPAVITFATTSVELQASVSPTAARVVASPIRELTPQVVEEEATALPMGR